MGWRDYKAWWAKYELSSLKEGQRCPEALLSQINDDAIIMSSARQRAIETAGQLGRGRDVKHDPMFNEAPLPAPKLGIFPMRPKNWNKIARLLWMLGHSGGEEHVSDAKRRAAKAATRSPRRSTSRRNGRWANPTRSSRSRLSTSRKAVTSTIRSVRSTPSSRKASG